jgi:GWxTD domain-containing protein
MCLIHRRNSLTALLLASLCFPLLPGQAQEQASVAPSQHGWLDPTVKEEYKKWINEDVRWIITDEERSDFKNLLSDKQRDAFIIEFWESRNPVPGAARNAYKEEHYRRLAYTNTHFAAGVPGWKTDRGRVYIMFGPPDSIEKHPATIKPKGQQTIESAPTNFAWEDWRYTYIDGIGKNATFEFVDTCRCGEFHMPLHPIEGDPPGIKQSFPQP